MRLRRLRAEILRAVHRRGIAGVDMTATVPSAASAGAPLDSSGFAAARDAAVRAESVRLLYRLSRPAYGGTLINAGVVVLALWSVMPSPMLLWWFAVMAVIVGARYALYRRFFAATRPPQEMAQWRRRFVTGAAAMGCGWGLLGAALLPGSEFLYQALIIFVVGGMVASALVVLTPVRTAFYSFALTALLPLLAAVFAQDGRIYPYVGVVLLVFTAVVLVLAFIMHRTHIEPLRARFDNEALVQQLSAANLALNQRIEAQRATEAALQRSSARLDALFEASPLAIVVQDAAGIINRWNRAAERTFGWSEREVLGRHSPTVPPEKLAEKAQFLERIRRGEEFLDIEATRRRKDGSCIEVSLSAAALRNAEGVADGSVMIFADISERRKAERLRQLEHAVTRVLSESQDIDEAIREVIRIFCETGGWAYGARWVLKAESQQLECLDAWHIESTEIAAFAGFNRLTQHHLRPRAGGLLRGVWASGEPVWMEDAALDPGFSRAAALARAGLHAAIAFPVLILGRFYGVIEFFATAPRALDDGLLQIARSIGSQIGQFIARREAEQNLTFFANHDALTGLPNRAMFSQRLTQALARAQRNGRKVAVMFVDLDRFKVINDTLGHDAGDRLLQQAATRLRSSLRESDTIARQGGDEFVVMVEDMAEVAQAVGVAQKVLDAVAEPYLLSGQECHVTASIGISVYPEDGGDVQALLKNADIAMYRAKDGGKNSFQFYSAQANRHSLARLALETDLRRALERQELHLHYQPKYDHRSGRITGVEALIRWNHPGHGAVAPAQLIALAEETGLIVAIGDWVLRTACRDARRWVAAGLPATPVAVNLSARQFGRDDLVEVVGLALADSGLGAAQLELEITESAVMDNAERAAAVLDRLHAMGVRVALDDFGTGYSSLGYLKRFPVDSVKIDRSFIADIPQDQDDVAITRAVIAMAHSLQLKVIAEGVETAEQLHFLQQQGCDEMQGFRFCRPCDAAALEKLLALPPQPLA
jgi:diguanylate cyclase (GGDEF)-like protein/PAS domain S-box-containing protein